MAPERWRLFVAVPISDELRRDLAASLDVWKQRPDLAGLRWTDPMSWHVTLAFIGSVEASGVPELVKRLTDAAATHAPMNLRTEGVGGFPSTARARVVWYGVDDPEAGLADLAFDLRRAAGVSHDDPFCGHITLGRARHKPVDVRAWARDACAPVGDLGINHVGLIRSHLGGGARPYEMLERVAVGATARV